jgi:hypothetical protein
MPDISFQVIKSGHMPAIGTERSQFTVGIVISQLNIFISFVEIWKIG